jgi:hypothetical protein
MLDRHDSEKMVVSRLLEDEKFDWFKKLDSLVWQYSNIAGKNVDIYNINANSEPQNVIEMVLYYINRYTEE